MLTNTYYPYEPRELVHPECHNFFMYEIFKSDTADRLDIDNTWGFTDEMREHAAHMTFSFLQPIRDDYGFTKITSWYRCEALEEVICEKSFKRFQSLDYLNNTWPEYFARKSHPKAEAIDYEVPGTDNDELFEIVQDLYPFDQLIREYRKAGDPSSGWIHQSMRIDNDNNYEVLHRP